MSPFPCHKHLASASQSDSQVSTSISCHNLYRQANPTLVSFRNRSPLVSRSPLSQESVSASQSDSLIKESVSASQSDSLVQSSVSASQSDSLVQASVSASRSSRCSKSRFLQASQIHWFKSPFRQANQSRWFGPQFLSESELLVQSLYRPVNPIRWLKNLSQ